MCIQNEDLSTATKPNDLHFVSRTQYNELFLLCVWLRSGFVYIIFGVSCMNGWVIATNGGGTLVNDVADVESHSRIFGVGTQSDMDLDMKGVCKVEGKEVC